MDAEAFLTKAVGAPVHMAENSTVRAGAWEWDLAADRWTLSAGLRQICGLGEGEEATPARLRTLIHPEDLPHVEHTLAAARADAQPIDVYLRIRRGGDGAVRHIHMAGDFVSAGPPRRSHLAARLGRRL